MSGEADLVGWTVATAEGSHLVNTALHNTDYTRLMLTLPNELMVPIFPLWIDLTAAQLAVLAPAELAPWMEASLIACSSERNRLDEASDGFAVAVTALILDNGALRDLSVASDGVAWTRRGRRACAR